MEGNKSNGFLSKIIGIIIVCIIFTFAFYAAIINNADNECAKTNYRCTQTGAENALKNYTTAEKIYKEPWVFEQKANMYLQLNDEKNALLEYQNAIKYLNNYPIYEQIMNIFTGGKQEVTDWNVKKILLYFNVGKLATNFHDYDLCIESFTNYYDALAVNNRAINDKDRRGYCYLKQGKKDLALKDYLEERDTLRYKIQTITNIKERNRLLRKYAEVEKQIFLCRVVR